MKLRGAAIEHVIMNLKADFLTIVYRRVMDFFRVRGRRPRVVSDELPECAAEAQPSGLDDDAVVLRQSLALLSERRRKVIELHYFEALGTRQIGERMGLAEGAVCADLFHARKTLRAALETSKNQPQLR